MLLFLNDFRIGCSSRKLNKIEILNETGSKYIFCLKKLNTLDNSVFINSCGSKFCSHIPECCVVANNISIFHVLLLPFFFSFPLFVFVLLCCWDFCVIFFSLLFVTDFLCSECISIHMKNTHMYLCADASVWVIYRNTCKNVFYMC